MADNIAAMNMQSIGGDSIIATIVTLQSKRQSVTCNWQALKLIVLTLLTTVGKINAD